MALNLKILVGGLILASVAVAVSCAHKKRRWIMDAPVQDLINHTLLESVGVGVVNLPPKIYEEELKVFVGEFIKDAAKYGVEIPADTRDMLRQIIYVEQLSMQGGPGVMAACNRYFTYQQTFSGQTKLNWMTIEVLRRESAEYTGTNERERLTLLREIMYHELFHCFFNKGHLPEGKSGIMGATFTKGSKRAFLEWDALVEEMFSQEYMDMIPDAS